MSTKTLILVAAGLAAVALIVTRRAPVSPRASYQGAGNTRGSGSSTLADIAKVIDSSGRVIGDLIGSYDPDPGSYTGDTPVSYGTGGDTYDPIGSYI